MNSVVLSATVLPEEIIGLKILRLVQFNFSQQIIRTVLQHNSKVRAFRITS